MSATAGIRAGRAYVEMFLKDLELRQGLEGLKKRLQAWKESAQQMGMSLLKVGAVMMTPFVLATKAAGDMMETMSKIKVMFGDQFAATDAWLNSFSKAVGRSKKDAADGLGAFQAMFVGMGMGSREASTLSQEMTALAIDFGSFHNVTDTESIERFISAFAGSSQVLDMFGINIKMSALDLKLLEMGFQTCQGGATELQKVLARAEIIRETMGKQGAIGDAVRTADSFSNTFKRMRAEVIDAAIQIGTIVMPVFRDLMTWFSAGIKFAMDWVNQNKEIAQWGAKIAAILIACGGALLALSFGLGVLLAMGKAVVLLGMAFKALHLLFMLPVTTWGAMFKGIVVVTALAYALGLLGSAYEEVTHKAQEQATANDQQRKDDRLVMARLEQLSQKQKLNNEEMTEASNLIHGLNTRYGHLGMSINHVTQRIDGLSAAQTKLNKIMREREIHDLEMMANEAGKNARSKQKEADSWRVGRWVSPLDTEKFFSGNTAKNERRREIQNEAWDFQEQERLLRAQIDAMRGGKSGGTKGPTALEVEQRIAKENQHRQANEQARKAAAEEAQKAHDELFGIEDEIRREQLSEVERKIDDAQKRGNERMGLIDRLMEGERTREGGMRPQFMRAYAERKNEVQQETEAEIVNLRRKAAEEDAIAVTEEWRKQLEEDAEKVARVSDARQGQLDDLARKELELKYAAKAGETEEQTAQRELEKRLALIELDRTQALRTAKEGIDPELINADADLEQRLAKAEFRARGLAATEHAFNAVGSFSAAVVGRLGQDSLEKQHLDVDKQQLGILKKIEKKEGGLVFGNGE